MATSDREFETNLSEELSPKEKENGSISCEEKDVVIGNENGAKACSSDDYVRDNFDKNGATYLGKDNQEFMDEGNKAKGSLNTAGNVDCNLSNTVSNSIDTEEQECNSTESIEGVKLDGFDKNSPPLQRSGGKGVDEALLEEDEMGCSEDEEEHYESAEEEHLAPEEAEVISVGVVNK